MIGKVETPRSRLLSALADDLGFQVVDYLARWPSARTNELAAELGVTDASVSKRITKLVSAGAVRLERQREPHTLVDPAQTIRALREIDRLWISLQRHQAAEGARQLAAREDQFAHDGNKTWDELFEEIDRPPAPPRVTRWQATDEVGIITLGPEEGVLVCERERRVVCSRDYRPFLMLVAGLTAGDLQIDPKRATGRIKRAVEALVPRYIGDLPISRHHGWRDATDKVYDSARLVEQLRRRLRIVGTGASRPG